MKRKIALFTSILFAAACTPFDDADLTERKTFMHFFYSGNSFNGTVVEIDADGGYILGGNIPGEAGNSDALIVKTDPQGNRLWEKRIRSSTVSAIRPYNNGYLILGDSIEINPGSENINESINTRARLLFMDNNQTISPNELIRRDRVIRNPGTENADTLQIDFHGNALAFNPAGDILVLGSFQVPGEFERSFITAVNPSDISAPLWNQNYGLLDRNYVNCNALYVTTSSGLVWASNTFRQTQTLSEEYVSVSLVHPNSVFENSSLLGENEARNHSVEDLQKSPTGYAVIGTYAERNGASANIFFARVDASGNIIANSARYFDGAAANIALENRDNSETDDHGYALAPTNGGYILAGTMASTSAKGEGGTDILLIKVDSFGNLLWSRLIGGTGDERVNAIRETPDGGFLLCGTNTIKGLSSIMLMKTDANGELKN